MTHYCMSQPCSLLCLYLRKPFKTFFLLLVLNIQFFCQDVSWDYEVRENEHWEKHTVVKKQVWLYLFVSSITFCFLPWNKNLEFEVSMLIYYLFISITPVYCLSGRVNYGPTEKHVMVCFPKSRKSKESSVCRRSRVACTSSILNVSWWIAKRFVEDCYQQVLMSEINSLPLFS